jgi:ferredoxin
VVIPVSSLPREEKSVRVVIDVDKCVAAGQCVVAAGDVFDQRDEDGIAVLIDENPPESEAANVREAIALCPARAIWLD